MRRVFIYDILDCIEARRVSIIRSVGTVLPITFEILCNGNLAAVEMKLRI